MRLLRLGLAAVLALAAAGGAWAFSHQRYGELLLEWRWRDQLRGAKAPGAGPATIGIHLALFPSNAPRVSQG